MQLKEGVSLILRKTFFAPAECRLVRISPCGDWIAFQAPINGIFNLRLASSEDPQSATP